MGDDALVLTPSSSWGAFVPRTRRQRVVGVLLVAVTVAVLVLPWVLPGRDPSWFDALFLLIPLSGPVVLLVCQPRSVVVSQEGLVWRGPGWRRSRSWSDLADIGTLSLDLGAGGRWVAARRQPHAPAPSSVLFPRRIVRWSRTGRPESLAGLVLLVEAGGRRVWTQDDETILEAVRRHAGDRWVGTL